jgi:hypothetical protein
MGVGKAYVGNVLALPTVGKNVLAIVGPIEGKFDSIVFLKGDSLAQKGSQRLIADNGNDIASETEEKDI